MAYIDKCITTEEIKEIITSLNSLYEEREDESDSDYKWHVEEIFDVLAWALDREWLCENFKRWELHHINKDLEEEENQSRSKGGILE